MDDLFPEPTITPKEYKVYHLFTSDLGRECLRTMMDELFWEEPSEEFFTEAHFAFYDGRRSVLRGFKATIDKVEAHIAKQNLKKEDE